MKLPPPPKFEQPPKPDWENPEYQKWFMEKFLTDEDRAVYAQFTPEQLAAMFADEARKEMLADQRAIEDLEIERHRLRKMYLRSGMELPTEDPAEWASIHDFRSYVVKYNVWRSSIEDAKKKSPR